VSIRKNGRNYKPRIVCIGGGTGLSVLLRGLKKYPVDITAIVTISDDGGSSGRLREDLHMPPPGDIRNVLVALADTEPLLQRVFQFRFQNGNGLAGHTLGNLVSAAMKELTGDFTQAVKEMSKVLAVRGQVLPASRQDVQLVATMTDGSIVKGESQITGIGKRIHRLSLLPPSPEPLTEVIQAIQEADAIVLGPGSIYTSILPNLLVKNVAETIQASTACKIYVCNVMTQPGETDHFKASDHIRVIFEHVGQGVIDTVILNSRIPPTAIQEQYAQKKQQMVLPDEDEIHKLGCQVIMDQLSLGDSLIRHDAERVSEHILELVQNRLNS
jgi:uncharacterized cofD-like protein